MKTLNLLDYEYDKEAQSCAYRLTGDVRFRRIKIAAVHQSKFVASPSYSKMKGRRRVA